MSGGTVLYNGEAWETNATWPTVNKVFNVAAFREPEHRFSTPAQAPNQRAQGYPMLPGGFLLRGSPQLTFFEGIYEVPAHEGANAAFCKYPNLVGAMKGGKRECLKPGTMTAAEIAAKQAEQKKVEASISASLKKSAGVHPCNVSYPVYKDGKAVPGQFQKATQYVKSVDAKGVQQIYSCPAPGKFLRTQAPVILKGLGESPLEKTVLAEQQSGYRTTELALIGALAAGLFLIWRS